MLQIYQSRGQNWQIGDLKALGFEASAGIQHTLMLGLHRNYVFFLCASDRYILSVKLRQSFDGKIVGLSSPRSKYNLLAITADELCYFISCLLNCLFRLPTKLTSSEKNDTGCGSEDCRTSGSCKAAYYRVLDNRSEWWLDSPDTSLEAC